MDIQMKYQTMMGSHIKGEPYPQLDFSHLDGLDTSWFPLYICKSNEGIKSFLEGQYARSSKITKCDYFYYVIYQPKEEVCENQ